MRSINSKKSLQTIHQNNSSPTRTFSFDLPLLPISTTCSSPNRRVLPRRSSQFLLRRSLSIGILDHDSRKDSSIKKDASASTMSLCSFTSDEYDQDDITMDSFDDVVTENDARIQRVLYNREVVIRPSFPAASHGNFTTEASMIHESATITPPTPTRLVLKMRPSSLPLPLMDCGDLYDGYSDPYDEDYAQLVEKDASVDDDFRQSSWPSNGYPLSPNVIQATTFPFMDTHNNGILISESESYDDDNENENIVPPSTPPPTWYQENSSTNPGFRLSPPPILRLAPKRVIYLPLRDNSNIISSFNNTNGSLHHLLLPDDF